MSEWLLPAAVFWILYLVDGLQVRRERTFRFVSFSGRRCANGRFSHWHFASPWPGGWHAATADLPFALSADGICNRSGGTAGRPEEAGPQRIQAYRWEEVRDIRAADGWLSINGSRFCRDTGHLSARELQALAATCAALPEPARSALVQHRLRRWFRPAHLRRRARLLRARTTLATTCNGTFVILAAAITAYVLSDAAQHVPLRVADAIARALPLWAGYLLVLHAVAVFSAARAHRRLQPERTARRRSFVFSSLLFPPQALHLRAAVGDGFFPAQHPLAYALAFASPAERTRWAFQTLADLRWPVAIPGGTTDPLSSRILAWHRTELEAIVRQQLAAFGVDADALLASPARDSRASCAYCPRCRDQFTTLEGRCPNGVQLQPLR